MTTPKSQNELNLKDATILIVDDNETNLSVLSNCLEDYGFTTFVATDGKLALSRASYAQPDLILLDVLLPDIDGFEICRRLKENENTQDIPVIFLTALTGTADKVKGFRLGAVDYITKPIQEEEVLARVTTHLRLRYLNERLEQQVQERTQDVIAINKQLQQEIDERKRTDEQLRYQANLLKTVSDAMISTDMAFVIQSWNKAAEKLYGWSAAEVLGKSLVDVLNPEYPFASRAEVLQKFKEGGQFEGEVLHHHKDGTVINILGSVSIVKDQLGQPIGAVSVNHDITDRRQAEEALKEYSERLEDMVAERTLKLEDVQEKLIRQGKLAILGQLSGSVGHELRNPLGVISNAVYFLQMLLTEADETVKEYLNIIASRVQESEKIVADLLNMSRTQSAAKEEVQLSHLITDILGQHPAPSTITVITDLDHDLPPLFVDSQQIRQVLTNLITNAYQAMVTGGELSLSAELDGEYLRLLIKDSGHGMSPQTLAKIFEPLFTTKTKGIGLGLVVSKNLLEVNGGTIEVQSTENQGSIFTLTLPLKAGP